MEKIIELRKPKQKLPICVELCEKTEEKSKNVENISLMFFWNMIPPVIDAYRCYCDKLTNIYLINHNFIKCEIHGRKETEIRK